MGYYINPSNETQETFLRREGTRNINPPKHLSVIPTDQALICLVDNYSFKAAGIIFSQHEYEAFNSPDDRRNKEWFQILRSKLYDVSDIRPELFEVF